LINSAKARLSLGISGGARR
jgi:hypothetical protein